MAAPARRLGGIANQPSASVLAALGDADIAIPHYEAAGERDGRQGRPRGRAVARLGAALALVRTGDDRRGPHAGRRTRSPSRAPPGRRTARRSRCAAWPSSPTRPSGSRLLRSARALLDGQPAARLRAQIDTDLAGLLVLAGATDPDREERIEEATRLLIAVESLAFREQLWPLRGRAARLLERLGHKPGEAEAADTLTQTRAPGRRAGRATACATARSPTCSASRSRPSSGTCRTSTASSASAHATTWPPRSAADAPYDRVA